MTKYLLYPMMGGFSLVGLYLSSLYSFLLFHSIAELFSIVIACTIFVIAWNARRFITNNYLIFIGIGYLFIGGLDLLHTFAYKGMAIFKGIDTDVPTQFWIAARYLESLSLLIAPVFFRRKLKPFSVFSAYTIIFLLLLLSIFHWQVFPVCFVEGAGLTPFKKISELVIVLILLAATGTLLIERRRFEQGILQWIILSLLLKIFSELSFTLYHDPYGLANLIGHFLKIVSFWCIYKAMIETGLRKPYSLLFKELEQSKELYHSLFMNMLNGFARHRILLDPDGRPVDYVFLEVNTAFERLTGLNKAALIGKSVSEVLPGIKQEPVDWIGIYGGVALTGNPIQFENYSDALQKWFSISAYSLQKGYFVTIFEDITERKRAEEALRKAKAELETRVQERTAELYQSKELLESIVRHIPVMLCFYDPEGRVKLLNSAFETVLGWNLAEAQNLNLFEWLLPDPAVREEIRSSIRAARPGWRDLSVRTRDGRELETSWTTVRLSDRSLIALGIDVSERKQVEKRLKLYMDRLERSNRELEDFAFIASHDLQEPLRKIRIFGDILTEKHSESIGDAGRDYIERMQAAAARMHRLVESLLTYSRVTTKGAPFSGLNLNDAVRTAMANLEVRIKESGGSVEVGELPVIRADSIQMVQLFQNLIGNALKFRKKGQRPRIRIHAAPVAGKASGRTDAVDIFVTDNGIGFDEKYLDRIFEPFQRLHGKDSFEGVGIGLAICQKIVKRHNGSITARSAPDAGATFIVRLPAGKGE